MTILRQPHRRHFTQIANEAVNDERLSFKALGLLVYLLSKPDGWDPSYRHLMTTHRDGAASVQAALKELETTGYLRRCKFQDETGRWDWVIEVYESPCVENPCTDSLSTKKDSGARQVEGLRPSTRGPSDSRKPNPIWDALTVAFGEPKTRPEQTRRGKIVKELRDAGADPEAIEYAIRKHKSLWPNASVTETSIWTHWSQLNHRPPREKSWAEREAENAALMEASVNRSKENPL